MPRGKGKGVNEKRALSSFSEYDAFIKKKTAATFSSQRFFECRFPATLIFAEFIS